MKDSKVIQSYARAFVDLIEDPSAKQHYGDIQKIAQDLNLWMKVINSHVDFKKIILSRGISVLEKSQLVSDLISKLQLSKVIDSFFQLLIQSNRITLIEEIISVVLKKIDEINGCYSGVVEAKAQETFQYFNPLVVNFFQKKFNFTPQLIFQKNNELAAGVRVLVGNWHMDISINHQLDVLMHLIAGEKLS